MRETKHDRGDKGCVACRAGYPRPCACGGLIHAGGGCLIDPVCDSCGTGGREAEVPAEPATAAEILGRLNVCDISAAVELWRSLCEGDRADISYAEAVRLQAAGLLRGVTQGPAPTEWAAEDWDDVLPEVLRLQARRATDRVGGSSV